MNRSDCLAAMCLSRPSRAGFLPEHIWYRPARSLSRTTDHAAVPPLRTLVILLCLFSFSTFAWVPGRAEGNLGANGGEKEKEKDLMPARKAGHCI
jgi:hypothetical protein